MVPITSKLEMLEEVKCLERRLPVNMTNILAVLDIIVNGQIKTIFRAERARVLYDQFQVFVRSVTAAQQAGKEIPE